MSHPRRGVPHGYETRRRLCRHLLDEGLLIEVIAPQHDLVVANDEQAGDSNLKPMVAEVETVDSFVHHDAGMHGARLNLVRHQPLDLVAHRNEGFEAGANALGTNDLAHRHVVVFALVVDHRDGCLKIASIEGTNEIGDELAWCHRATLASDSGAVTVATHVPLRSGLSVGEGGRASTNADGGRHGVAGAVAFFF